MKPRSRQPARFNRRSPRGTIAVLVLVAMVTAVLVAMAALHRTGRQYELNKIHAYENQAAAIAESALDLARTRLAADPDYSGETWQIAADQIPLDEPAQVTIAVTQADSPNRRQIDIQVTLGREPPRQVSQQLRTQLSEPQLND